MQIDVSGLSEGVHQYELSKTAVDLGLESNFSDKVSARITLEKSDHQFLATVNASVKGVFICDRCADEYTDVVKTTFTSVYSWEQEEETDDDDDFHILRIDENIIDLSPVIKEYLTLAVPIKLLCKKNCVIPEHIALEKHAIDPRWEKLQTLVRSEKN